MVSLPPVGMASRALTARFMRTCSTWPGSALTGPRLRLSDGDQLDVLADEPAEHLLRVGDDVVEVEHPRRQHLLAAEGQQLPRQRGRPLGRPCAISAQLAHGLVGRQDRSSSSP